MPEGPVITIHRAADEIGGKCIEFEHDGHRLLLDAGSPLAGDEAPAPQGAIPRTVDTSKANTGLVISHPHQDHWGLLRTLPTSSPVWSGAASEVLIRMTASLSGAVVEQRFRDAIQPPSPPGGVSGWLRPFSPGETRIDGAAAGLQRVQPFLHRDRVVYLLDRRDGDGRAGPRPRPDW